jgi:DNA mismatch repair protein MutS2
MRIKVPISDLESLQSGKSQAPSSVQKRERQSRNYAEVRVVESGSAPFIRTDRNTIDLRGRRVEDALLETEKFLDQCAVAGIPTVMIIHGHGTGAVRNAIRDYLSQSQYAQAFRSGENHEGGNGVTIVRL